MKLNKFQNLIGADKSVIKYPQEYEDVQKDITENLIGMNRDLKKGCDYYNEWRNKSKKVSCSTETEVTHAEYSGSTCTDQLGSTVYINSSSCIDSEEKEDGE